MCGAVRAPIHPVGAHARLRIATAPREVAELFNGVAGRPLGAGVPPSERRYADSSSKVRDHRCVAGRPGRGGGASPGLRTAARLSPHLLRHFAASDLYRNGMNVVAIQEVLGHQWG